MKIAIAGTGYVGLVTAAVFAETGHSVCCVDINHQKIEDLKIGICPIYEPGLQSLLAKNKGRLEYTTDAKTAYKNAEVIFIAVGTPEKKDGSANLQYVYEACEIIASSVDSSAVVVIKSTVPIGTNDKIENFFKEKAKKAKIEVVSNPEFLSQGTAVNDMLFPNRVIIGAESERAKQIMQSVYAPFTCPVLFMNRRSAEMVKYASNDFLALKISYVNEIANLCEHLDADITDVTRGMGLDPRIGNKFLGAGIGFGGSCFPKDTKALHWLSGSFDCEIKTIKSAIEVNENQKNILLKKGKKYYDSFENLEVAILGLSFKPGTDDLRESPSISNVAILLDYGAKVRVWDAAAMPNFQKLFPDIKYCSTPKETLLGADLCFILTAWNEVKELKPEDFYVMKNPVILDGRNVFKIADMEKSKLIYDSIGRKVINNLPK